jgi:hypothetical protein
MSVTGIVDRAASVCSPKRFSDLDEVVDKVEEDSSEDELEESASVEDESSSESEEELSSPLV